MIALILALLIFYGMTAGPILVAVVLWTWLRRTFTPTRHQLTPATSTKGSNR